MTMHGKRQQDARREFAGVSERRLSDAYSYLILDARYERVREGGVITNQAVLIAVAVDCEGRRQVRAVELANREGRPSWRDFSLDPRGYCRRPVRLRAPPPRRR